MPLQLANQPRRLGDQKVFDLYRKSKNRSKIAVGLGLSTDQRSRQTGTMQTLFHSTHQGGQDAGFVK